MPMLGEKCKKKRKNIFRANICILTFLSQMSGQNIVFSVILM